MWRWRCRIFNVVWQLNQIIVKLRSTVETAMIQLHAHTGPLPGVEEVGQIASIASPYEVVAEGEAYAVYCCEHAAVCGGLC